MTRRIKEFEMTWREQCVPVESVLERIKPGTSIFLGTGAAEPRTLVKHLMASEAYNLEDLELIQLVSFGEATTIEELNSRKCRLKTFFSGGIASEAITAGRVDVIPSRFSRIPALLEAGLIPIQVAFVQVSPPNDSGYCSFGSAIDVARQAMEQAELVVGEINENMPRTFGDTFAHISEFDLLVEGTEEPFTFPPWPAAQIFDEVAANVASVVENGACLGFTLGPLYDALARQLAHKKHLGIHSAMITDAMKALIESGAVTNRRKEVFRGKSLGCYALGSKELLEWLDSNPLVEFQGLDKVFSPLVIGKNRNVFCCLPARKVDLSGMIALHFGKGNIAAGPGEAIDYVNGAELSEGGRVCFALPSRNREGEPNILLSVKEFPNQFTLRESVDMVVTDHGVAYLRGRSVRERAQALIEVAHPDDRPALVEQAKAARILYRDQIFIPESAHLYPRELETEESFGDLKIRFRAIRPSDEEEMRRLFYRFSDQSVYYRYFTRVRSMPHSKMQQYANVDYMTTLSLVGLVGEVGTGHIIAEGRFVKHKDRNMADVAFIVDEEHQGRGIATYLIQLLMHHAKERGLEGFTADVLASNKAMMKVFEKVGLPIRACLEEGAYSLTMPFDKVS